MNSQADLDKPRDWGGASCTGKTAGMIGDKTGGAGWPDETPGTRAILPQAGQASFCPAIETGTSIFSPHLGHSNWIILPPFPPRPVSFKTHRSWHHRLRKRGPKTIPTLTALAIRCVQPYARKDNDVAWGFKRKGSGALVCAGPPQRGRQGRNKHAFRPDISRVPLVGPGGAGECSHGCSDASWRRGTRGRICFLSRPGRGEGHLLRPDGAGFVRRSCSTGYAASPRDCAPPAATVRGPLRGAFRNHPGLPTSIPLSPQGRPA